MKSLELKSLLIFFLLSIGLVFLDSKKYLDAPKSFVQIATVPVWGILSGTRKGAIETFSFLTFWRSGEARIKNLELRVLELSGEKARADGLFRENADLRMQLGAAARSEAKLLPATVLSLSARGLGEIGIGTDGGVGVGQSVVYGNNLVGRVISTTSRTSLVLLASDPASKIPVKIGNSRGLLEGAFRSAMNITQVGQDETVIVGDLVVTSGEGGTYLPGLLVGKVSGVGDDKTAVFQQISATPLVNFSKLETVFVAVP